MKAGFSVWPAHHMVHTQAMHLEHRQLISCSNSWHYALPCCGIAGPLLQLIPGWPLAHPLAPRVLLGLVRAPDSHISSVQCKFAVNHFLHCCLVVAVVHKASGQCIMCGLCIILF